MLRHFRRDDAALVAALHRDARLRRHLVDDHPLDRVDAAGLFVQRLLSFYRQFAGLGIWHATQRTAPQAERFAGWFSLMPLASAPLEVEIGARLRPDAWGQGLALEGGECLLRHAFDVLGRHRVWGVCSPSNAGARLCLLALGFIPAGSAHYEGAPALHHVIAAERATEWLRQSRRDRLRHAATTFRRQADPAHDECAMA